MKNELALYHLRKIIALRQEEQKHIDALKENGIELCDSDTNIIYTKNGKQNFGLPLDEAGDCEYLGVLII